MRHVGPLARDDAHTEKSCPSSSTPMTSAAERFHNDRRAAVATTYQADEGDRTRVWPRCPNTIASNGVAQQIAASAPPMTPAVKRARSCMASAPGCRAISRIRGRAGERGHVGPAVVECHHGRFVAGIAGSQ